MDGTDDLIRLAELGAIFTVQVTFELFDLPEFIERLHVVVEFEEQKRDVPLHFADLGADLTSMVVLEDTLNGLEAVQSLLECLGLVLQFGKRHRDLRQVVSLGVLLHGGERVEGPLLSLDCMVVVSGLREDLAHLEVRVAELLLPLLCRLLGVFDRMRQVDLLNMLQLLDGTIEVLLLCVDLRDNGEDGGIAHMIATQDLYVHLKALLEQ